MSAEVMNEAMRILLTVCDVPLVWTPVEHAPIGVTAWQGYAAGLSGEPAWMVSVARWDGRAIAVVSHGPTIVHAPEDVAARLLAMAERTT